MVVNIPGLFGNKGFGTRNSIYRAEKKNSSHNICSLHHVTKNSHVPAP